MIDLKTGPWSAPKNIKTWVSHTLFYDDTWIYKGSRWIKAIIRMKILFSLVQTSFDIGECPESSLLGLVFWLMTGGLSKADFNTS